MTSVQSEVGEAKQFIAGGWTDAAGGGTFEDRDPFTGDVVARVPAGGTRGRGARRRGRVGRIPRVVADACRPSASAIFLKAADILERRRDEVVGLLARETGAHLRLRDVPDGLRAGAASARRPRSRTRRVGQVIPSDHPGTLAMGMRRPVGVVGAIAPWNAALILSARSIAAPLALGNTVVLKPSERSPIVGGLLWGEIFAEAGLPAGVLNIVTHAPGEAAPIGDELVENPAVRRINFTGSTATGRRLAEAAGRQLKRVVLELGGLEPADRARRRRPRLRRQRLGVRRVPAPGADLHVGAPDHRRAADRRGVHRAARREDEDAQGRRPERARHDHRAADQRGRARRW